MKIIMPFLFLPLIASTKTIADFEGEYMFRHSLYVVSENSTLNDVEDNIKIQRVSDKKAHILIETYAQNFHSCQLVGVAELDGDILSFKSSVNKKLNRGKTAHCILKISQNKNTAGDKVLKVVDENDNCRLRYCGMSAELGGEFTQKKVLVQEKN